MPSSLSSTRSGVNTRPPVAESLRALAPLHLPNRRQARSFGDELCVPLAELARQDQLLLRSLYGSLSELLSTIADPSTDDPRKWQEVALWAEPRRLDAFIDVARELGSVSQAQNSGESLAKAMHDVRGGALSALLGRLQLLNHLPQTSKELTIIFVLVRDHLKIMRSAVTGLDDARRDADRRPKSHDMKLMLAKWHESVVGPNWHERPLRMHVDCRHEGALTECCLESAAIDRIFYNLVNNACRHAVGSRLDMTIFPVPEPPGECLRFVLSNEVDATDATFLSALVQAGGADSVDKGAHQSMFSLFEPDVSSTGSGFGLTVVADFIADAFGLRDRQEALRERYVGAILDGNLFRVWFHWPVADHTLPPKLDDYHRPQESLSEPETGSRAPG